jgi:glycosyltransferase involved in cell wall biosynthesis
VGRSLVKKSIAALKHEGFFVLLKRTFRFIFIKSSRSSYKHRDPAPEQQKVFCDVLFIDGCGKYLPHPARYRVSHQREQLFSCNISSREVFFEDLRLDMLRYYRLFIFFRCPYTDMVGKFISEAKALNKTVLFDIDDLVMDTKYTDLIRYVREMPPEEKKNYDDGVYRYGKTMRLCEAVITTTERLERELSDCMPEVFINRNTASERMTELSDDAVYERDVLPHLKRETVPKKDLGAYEHAVRNARKREKTGVRIGYFSGSITHNEDFEMILPSVRQILEAFPSCELHVVGDLDIPIDLRSFESQITRLPYTDWEDLPRLIANVDINLAPLKDSIFNEAKSEIKWIEAALVKIPTIASNIGAFARMIEDGETGILCDRPEDWHAALERMISDVSWRERIGENAYRFCREKCTTMYTGFPLSDYVKKKMRPNSAVILPSLNVSGGILVALRHSAFLRDKGYDVTLLVDNDDTEWCEFEESIFPVLNSRSQVILGEFEKGIATHCSTMIYLEVNNRIKRSYYLVQNFETDFYLPNDPLRMAANQSYFPHGDVRFVTISHWCRRWLKEKFNIDARYARNGIDLEKFYPVPRDFSGIIRVLIEGDSSSYYKNVDESFKIVDLLPKDRYEIWYMSYHGEPKPEYRVDRFLHKIPHDSVSDIYRQCHILIKTSILESFSYPPLEMMATGGYVVALPNGGNLEYLVDGENCLMYQRGDTEGAANAVKRIAEDAELREKLFAGGQKKAQERSWTTLNEEIIALYDEG